MSSIYFKSIKGSSPAESGASRTDIKSVCTLLFSLVVSHTPLYPPDNEYEDSSFKRKKSSSESAVLSVKRRLSMSSGDRSTILRELSTVQNSCREESSNIPGDSTLLLCSSLAYIPTAHKLVATARQDRQKLQVRMCYETYSLVIR